MAEQLIKALLRKAGIQLKRYPDKDLKNRQVAMSHFNINKIFDVGANIGQYAMEMRDNGFKGEIISFEPLSSAFKVLEKKAATRKNWTVHNMAIGDSDGETTIHIASNSQSSSIREMLPAHLESAPESAYMGDEKITVRTLDTVFDGHYRDGDNILLKIDTQGYEKNVIDGAVGSLSRIRGIKLEMSLVPLYDGEMLFWDMVPYIVNKGFRLYSLENTYADARTGQLMQVDGTFYR